MESWTMYDKLRQPTGREINRGERIRPGDYHLVVYVCIFNLKGEMLIQQRQPFKQGWSGMWDITWAARCCRRQQPRQPSVRSLRR